MAADQLPRRPAALPTLIVHTAICRMAESEGALTKTRHDAILVANRRQKVGRGGWVPGRCRG